MYAILVEGRGGGGGAPPVIFIHSKLDPGFILITITFSWYHIWKSVVGGLPLLPHTRPSPRSLMISMALFILSQLPGTPYPLRQRGKILRFSPITHAQV